jgi:hypothetical protein
MFELCARHDDADAGSQLRGDRVNRQLRTLLLMPPSASSFAVVFSTVQGSTPAPNPPIAVRQFGPNSRVLCVTNVRL